MIQLCHALLVTSAPSSGWTSWTVFFSRPWLAELQHIPCIQLCWHLYWDKAIVFHFPVCHTDTQSPVCTLDHWVVYPAAFFSSFRSTPLPWPFPLPNSMMFWCGCQSYSNPFGQDGQSKDRVNIQVESAGSGIVFRWAKQKDRFASSSQSMRRMRLELLAALFPIALFRKWKYSWTPPKTPRIRQILTGSLSLWIHSCLRLVPIPFFQWYDSRMVNSIRLTLWPQIILWDLHPEGTCVERK